MALEVIISECALMLSVVPIGADVICATQSDLPNAWRQYR